MKIATVMTVEITKEISSNMGKQLLKLQQEMLMDSKRKKNPNKQSKRKDLAQESIVTKLKKDANAEKLTALKNIVSVFSMENHVAFFVDAKTV